MKKEITYQELITKFSEGVVVMPHQGLGDHIISNGMIRKISQDLRESRVGEFIKKYFYKLMTLKLFNYRLNIQCEYDKILFLLCKESKYKLVSYMYRDNPNIILVKFPDDHESVIAKAQLHNPFALTLGCWSHLPFNENYSTFDVEFYNQANINFSARFDNFYVERDVAAEKELLAKYNVHQSDSEYIFIHEEKIK